MNFCGYVLMASACSLCFGIVMTQAARDFPGREEVILAVSFIEKIFVVSSLYRHESERSSASTTGIITVRPCILLVIDLDMPSGYLCGL